MKIGSPVYCVDDSIPAEHFLHICEHYPNWVEKKKKYHIREFRQVNGDGRVGVLLEEIRNPLRTDIVKNLLIEPGFDISRFREAEESTAEEPSIKAEELVGLGVGVW